MPALSMKEMDGQKVQMIWWCPIMICTPLMVKVKRFYCKKSTQKREGKKSSSVVEKKQEKSIPSPNLEEWHYISGKFLNFIRL